MALKNAEYTRLGDPVLLDKIDQLFACNVGDYIDLPQLVVVGDQSSGKSSVLEGLTKLPFPRNSGLCTRFATQITFRRARERRITVSIIPHAGASSQHAERMKGWSTKVQDLDIKTFEDIMIEVHEVMGLSNQNGVGGSQNTFSSDVLRLEIVGPKEDHLSVIDVPGIFKITTPGKTTKDDINMVREMVLGYMQNPRSVMLTVVAANVDIATQEIVEIARELDPNGDRTLGVLTKPDLVDKGAEYTVVDIVNGKGQGSKVQWSVVRNPGQQELESQSTDRRSEERFFKESQPWNGLEKDKVGITALHSRLQEVITCHTRREFPKVKLEIGKRLKVAKDDLKSLGVERDTAEKQSRFLFDILKRFQDVTSLALATNYGADDLFDEHPELRLATEAVHRNSLFSDHMHKWGQEYWFDSAIESSSTPSMEPSFTYPPSPPEEDSSPFADVKVKAEESKPTKPSQIHIRTLADPAELQEILHGQETLTAPSRGIFEWLETTYMKSRGFELGTFEPNLLSNIMKKQSVKWNGLALGYISDMVVIVHGFIIRLLRSLCADERVQENLLSGLMDPLIEKYRSSLDRVRFILKVETGGTPMTENHYFNDTLQICRSKRMQAALKPSAVDGCQHGEVVRFEDIVQHHPMSNTEHTIHDIHDILKSYYKVAHKRFVDNVCKQAADYCLITGPDTPLRLLSPDYILSLTEQQLEDIAGEDPRLKRRRQQLNREIDELERGRKILL